MAGLREVLPKAKLIRWFLYLLFGLTVVVTGFAFLLSEPKKLAWFVMILLLLTGGVWLFFWGFDGFRTGEVYVRNAHFTRENNSLALNFFSLLFLLMGLLSLFFAVNYAAAKICHETDNTTACIVRDLTRTPQTDMFERKYLREP